MPESIFVWTFRDVFGLAILAIFLLVVVIAVPVIWVQEKWRAYKRKKNMSMSMSGLINKQGRK